MTAHLLIVEDDASLNQMLALHFEDRGFTTTGVLTCADARESVRRDRPDVVLLDMQLPDGTGLELLSQLRELAPELPVVMVTGQHDLELAIDAIKAGAVDYLHKPIDTELLDKTVSKAIRQAPREGQRPVPAVEAPQRDLIGRSAAMLEVSKAIAVSAETAANVLITGESGTGKEVVARLIHQYSSRAGPFVAVNCAAIVDTLLESELFGHEKGAFTGASERKLGRFEVARDGTLFLDEVGELALPLQAKLLRALQERAFQRVGGNQDIEMNARLIAATNRDLAQGVRAGTFREDLLYRLNVIAIHLPPLRERPEDIPLLVEALLKKISAQVGKPAVPLSAAALARLKDHGWPGNVRELENVLTRALVQNRGPEIPVDLFLFSEGSSSQPAPDQSSAAGVELKSLNELEAEHIQKILNYTAGHKGRTCEILGISRPALDRKIEKYDLKLPR
ncbi:MAG: sigma-54 dependent transcriptional regulator [Pseudomonadota bacterium]